MKRILLIAGLLATSSLTAYADRLPICRPSMDTTECIQTSPTDGRFCDRFEPGNPRLPESDCGRDKKRVDSFTPDFGKAKTRGGGGEDPVDPVDPVDPPGDDPVDPPGDDDPVDPPDDDDDDPVDPPDDDNNDDGHGCKKKCGGHGGHGDHDDDDRDDDDDDDDDDDRDDDDYKHHGKGHGKGKKGDK